MGAPSKFRLGGLVNSQGPKQAAEKSFQRPQLPSSKLEFFRSPLEPRA
jgi:hypothetical protein